MTEDISCQNSNNTFSVQDGSKVNTICTSGGDEQNNSDVNVNVESTLLYEVKDSNDINESRESVRVNNIYDQKSFRITSVTVQHNLTKPTDNAQESANELHTEELCDNTDMSAVNIQTNAVDCGFMQNDIIRKDDVLYKVTSLGSAPIIPTSAQYGIAVVSNPNAEFADNVNKFVADNKLTDYRLRSEYLQNGLNGNCGANLTNKEFNTKNERFKVVKIESNEPFRRGRWVCMDFLDQSMDQIKKAAAALNDNTCKQKDIYKESTPEILMINGMMNTENICNDVCYTAEIDNPLQTQLQMVQFPNESTSHVNGDASNAISPNQTSAVPFMSSSNMSQSQSQTQSLTHITIPQVSQTSTIMSAGSYGHSQSSTFSELQHNQISQQPGVPTTSSLSFVSLTSSQSPTVMSQNLQNSSHQQCEPILNQSGTQQQPPILQSYQPIQQSNMNQTSQQRTTNPQLVSSQPQVANISCTPQISQSPATAISGNNVIESTIIQQNSSQVTSSPPNQHFQTNQSSCQQPLQQMSQQTYSQQATQVQNASQSGLITSVQMSNQHHSPQANTPSIHQIPSQTQSTQSNAQLPIQSSIQQPIHLSTQTPVNQPPIQSSVQYVSQPSLSHSTVSQSTPQHTSQTTISQPVQSHPQQMILQPIGSTNANSANSGNSSCGNESQQVMQTLQQQQQQQQQQIQQPQQISAHQQSLQHVASQTSPSQQIQNQHHQSILQSVPQQQQQQQQPQIIQSQINIQHQGVNLQNTSSGQTIPAATQHNSQQQIVKPSLQTMPQSQPQSHTLLPSSQQQLPQQAQPIHASVQATQQLQSTIVVPQNQPIVSNGNQTIQSQYQNTTASSQISDANIPVLVSQTPYQHEVVMSSLSQPDVMLQNQYPQSQNITTPHNLHVSMQQPYSNTNSSSHHVNTSNINLVPTSISSQQTSQFFNQQALPPCSQPSCSISSQTQDVQQSCTQQLQNISNIAHSTLVPTTLPTIQNGAAQHTTQSAGISGQHSYSMPQTMYSQNGVTVISQTSTNVQTQTTPILQTCTTSTIPIQQYSIPLLNSGTVPVSTTYLTNVNAMQPPQLSVSASILTPTPSYVATSSQSATHIYATAPSATATTQFIDVADQELFHRASSQFQEQVAECVRNEESSFQRSNEDVDDNLNGNNSVAIDNKIEQAMDLVKSHLMFAVREEVEVLKEKIAELMDRINQLEIENSILKANATQETLAQLPLHQSNMTSTISISGNTRLSSVVTSTNSNVNSTTNSQTT